MLTECMAEWTEEEIEKKRREIVEALENDDIDAETLDSMSADDALEAVGRALAKHNRPD